MKDLPYLTKPEGKSERLYSEEEVRAIENKKKDRTASDILRLYAEGQWRFDGR